MNTTLRLLVTLLCVAVLCGCASSNPSGSGGPPASDDTTTAKSTPTAAADERVAAVSFRRSGGLKPVQVTRVFKADSAPPQGFSKADVAAVLRAAQALVSADAKVRPLPKNTCCDKYEYSVSIVLSDGSTRTYQTVDGLNQPRAFDDLLSRLASA
jgi:hypothetical protein